jgi:uncharacterized metal-binding protein YceD (DUF177 family)
MRLDITELLRETGKHERYEIQEPPLVDEDVECTQPVEGHITFTNAGGALIIKGKANTQVALPCSRCGEYFEQPVALDIDEMFELRHVSAGPRTLATVAIVEEDESPVAAPLFDGSVFELTEMLRQYILLDEPTQPLPPALPDGRCAHCLRHAADVLRVLAEAAEMPEVKTVNPALAKLGALLEEKPEPE